MKRPLFLFLILVFCINAYSQDDNAAPEVPIPVVEKISPQDCAEIQPGGIEFSWKVIKPSDFDSSKGFITYAIEIQKLQDNSWFLLKRRVVSPQAGKDILSFVFTIPEGSYNWTVRAIYGVFVNDSRPNLIPGPSGDLYSFSCVESSSTEVDQGQSEEQLELQDIKVNIQKSYNRCIAENWSLDSLIDYLKTIDQAVEIFSRIAPDEQETVKIKEMRVQAKEYTLDQCHQKLKAMEDFCESNNWTAKFLKDFHLLLRKVLEIYNELIPNDSRTVQLQKKLKASAYDLKKLESAEKIFSGLELSPPALPVIPGIIPPKLPEPATVLPEIPRN